MHKIPRGKIWFLMLVALPAMAVAQGDARLDLAKQWEQNGELDRAVQELRLHLSEHPDDADAWQWMGDVRMKLGRYKQAADSYRSGLQRDPGRAALQEKLAQAEKKMAEGDAPVAPPIVETKTVPPEPPPAPAKVPETAPSTVAPEAAPVKPVVAEPPKTAVPETPKSAASKTEAGATPKPVVPPEKSNAKPAGIYAMPEFLSAVELYRTGKKDEAANALRKVLVKTPNHPGAYYLGGVIRYERGEFDKAEYNFKRGFSFPEKGFNAHYYLGRIYQKQGKAREAVVEYEEYKRLTQNEEGRRQADAALAELRAKVPKAAPAPEVKPVAAHKPEKAPVAPTVPKSVVHEEAGVVAVPAAAAEGVGHSMGGGLLFVIADAKGKGAAELEAAREFLRAEKYEKGVQELKRIQVGFAGTENAAVVPLDLGANYLKLGLWDQASAQADDYLEQNKGGRFDRYANYLKALALIGLGQGRSAEKILLDLRTGSGFGPPPEETAYHLARSAESQGDARRQLSYLAEAEKGIREPARLMWIRQRMGRLWSELLDEGKAAASYRSSLQLCSDSTLAAPCAESTVRLGDAAFRQRAYPEALAAYEDLLRRASGHPEAGWAQYQIGNIRRLTGDIESALHAYQRVIDNYPGSYWAEQARWRKDDAVWRKEYEGVLD